MSDAELTPQTMQQFQIKHKMFNNDLEKNKNLVHNNQYNNGNEKHSGGNQE